MGAASLLGHLDLQSTFHKAIRRARLPVAYSQGFSPHQLISFAMPLPIGMEGFNEYVDIDFDGDVSAPEIIGPLNAALPDGLTVTGAVARKGKPSAARVIRAEYAAWPGDWPVERLNEIIAEMLAAESLIVMKATKSGAAPADIRADIFALSAAETAGGAKINAILSAGGERNLKPSAVVGYLAEKLETDARPASVRYARKTLILRD
jgi:radical SAM-linked protein